MMSKFAYTLTALLASVAFLDDGVSAFPRPQDLNAGPVLSDTPAVANSGAGRVQMRMKYMTMSRSHPARGMPLINDSSLAFDTEIRITDAASLGLAENTDNYWAGTRAGVESFEKSFNDQFEKNIDKLPKIGRSGTAPWPSDYWPSYRGIPFFVSLFRRGLYLVTTDPETNIQLLIIVRNCTDGINFAYDGQSMSPAAKYAQAKGINPKMLADAISKVAGIDAWPDQPRCQGPQDCQASNDGSVCAKRTGSATGYCIPSWFGLCHAWAPAAILEPEPKCSVTKNGVTFGVMDIKALITQMYDGSHIGTFFAGTRCSDKDSATDEHGRMIDIACRDTAPDFFHIASANILGRLKKAFLVDITGNSEVWNQPVLSFSSENQVITKEEAIALVNPNEGTYKHTPEAVKFRKVTTVLNYIVEGVSEAPIATDATVGQFVKNKEYTYVLELDEKDTIIGGEWTGDSKKDHPDFVWIPTSKPNSNTVAAGIEYDFVRSLVEESQACSV